MGKFDQSPDAIEDRCDNPIGCVWVVLSNVGADFVNIVEGFRVSLYPIMLTGGRRRACVFSIKRR